MLTSWEKIHADSGAGLDFPPRVISGLDAHWNSARMPRESWTSIAPCTGPHVGYRQRITPEIGRHDLAYITLHLGNLQHIALERRYRNASVGGPVSVAFRMIVFNILRSSFLTVERSICRQPWRAAVCLVQEGASQRC